MPLFKVNVTVTKHDSYEMQVYAEDEAAAESIAQRAWREQTSEDFQVDRPDEWEVESEQLTWECVECGVNITREQNVNGDEMCEKCVAAYDASEALAKGVSV
jgi:hypothetical protein